MRRTGFKRKDFDRPATTVAALVFSAAQAVARDEVHAAIATWRENVRELLPAPKPVVEPREPAYLAWVRTQPCCVSGARAPSHAHHQHGEKGTGKAMGRKAPDSTAVPLSRVMHDAWHTRGHFPGMSREKSIAKMRAARARLRAAWKARRQ